MPSRARVAPNDLTRPDASIARPVVGLLMILPLQRWGLTLQAREAGHGPLDLI
jgi:hypothetical protein